MIHWQRFEITLIFILKVEIGLLDKNSSVFQFKNFYSGLFLRAQKQRTLTIRYHIMGCGSKCGTLNSRNGMSP